MDTEGCGLGGGRREKSRLGVSEAWVWSLMGWWFIWCRYPEIVLPDNLAHHLRLYRIAYCLMTLECITWQLAQRLNKQFGLSKKFIHNVDWGSYCWRLSTRTTIGDRKMNTTGLICRSFSETRYLMKLGSQNKKRKNYLNLRMRQSMSHNNITCFLTNHHLDELPKTGQE
ncbi:hypothetical protein PIB30_040876 [Stylosanthes scabra]|uniref:Uncharacterized protein n=1 Tax=Stylosanthes scabra TaxID=79078 RepID=A0ABU6SG34_9FABA|nr:hypothetical protein [Stylosanthes scabra]